MKTIDLLDIELSNFDTVEGFLDDKELSYDITVEKLNEELNKEGIKAIETGIVNYIVEDWISNRLGEFNTLEGTETFVSELADGDEGVEEDLYIYGLNVLGENVVVEF